MNTTLKQQKNKFWRPWMLPASVLVFGFLEMLILVLIGAKTSIWWVLLIVLVGFIISLALLLAAGQQSITRLVSMYKSLRGTGDISKHLSKPAFTLVAALLFFFPGILTDLLALVLLLTPVQRKLVNRAGISSDQIRERGTIFGPSSQPAIQGEIIIDGTAAKSEYERRQNTDKADRPAIEGEVV